MGVIRVRDRNYVDVVDRIHDALKKSDRLNVWHQANTTQIHTLSEDSSYPLFCVHYTPQQTNAALIYVSAGIHGDEPAGVECALRLIELLADDTQHYSHPFPFYKYNWLISPCDNPYGYERDIRKNAECLDLNRMFETPNRCSETAFIAESLLLTQFQHAQKQTNHNTIGKSGTIELALDLHEDTDSDGFYLWERRASTCHPIGGSVVKNVERVCAINREPWIEEHRNENGMITLLDTVTTKGWTRGRYLAEQIKTRCLILETPTQSEWETRINVHMMAIQSAVKHALKAQ